MATEIPAHVVTALKTAYSFRITGGQVSICPCGTHVTAYARYVAQLGDRSRAAMAAHFASGTCGLVESLSRSL